MKKVDDTPVPESESDARFEYLSRQIDALNRVLTAEIEELEKRIANLETQRTPQDENDDPEWY